MTQSFCWILFVRVAFTAVAMLCAAVAPAQQPPVNYRLDWIALPAEVPGAEVHDMNNAGVLVGRCYLASGTGALPHVGFVYDHPGVLGTPLMFYLLPDLITVGDEWTDSSCIGINDAGLVVGALSTIVDGVYTKRTGFVMDVLAEGGPVWKYLPHPPESDFVVGNRINANGDVLGTFKQDGGQFAYLYHVADDSSQYTVLSDPDTGLPVALKHHEIDLNNLAQVSGRNDDGWFRLTPGLVLESIDESRLQRVNGINDFGMLCGSATIPGTRKNQILITACRYLDQLEYVQPDTDAPQVGAWGVNNSGDLAIDDYQRSYLYHSPTDSAAGSGVLNLDDLLAPDTPQADRDFWDTAEVAARKINERDATGFPQLGGVASRTTTTGKGKNQVTTSEVRIFVLTPVSPNP